MIKSVFNGIKSYWSQLFLLPRKLLKEVKGVCRSFLWANTSAKSKSAPIDWETVCLSIKCGGFNLRQLASWNKSAICNQLWAIDMKTDRLWIRWGHVYYLMNNTVVDIIIPTSRLWMLRKILSQRDTCVHLKG